MLDIKTITIFKVFAQISFFLIVLLQVPIARRVQEAAAAVPENARNQEPE